jgi:hypothetical protein
LKKRLRKDRPSTTITMRIPADVVESLKAVAPQRGFTAYQTLLKSYISEGLRRDEAALGDMTEAFSRRAARRVLRKVEWQSKRRKSPELRARFADEAARSEEQALSSGKTLELAATFDYLTARASGTKALRPKARAWRRSK